MSFITVNSVTIVDSITIDGKAPNLKITHFPDGGSAVQLRRARQEESGFNWNGLNVKKVILKNVLIYDEIDVKCVAWFIASGILIDGKDAFLSPDACEIFESEMKSLIERNIKVVEGSTIHIPVMQGYSGMGSTGAVDAIARKIGFKTAIYP